MPPAFTVMLEAEGAMEKSVRSVRPFALMFRSCAAGVDAATAVGGGQADDAVARVQGQIIGGEIGRTGIKKKRVRSGQREGGGDKAAEDLGVGRRENEGARGLQIGAGGDMKIPCRAHAEVASIHPTGKAG